MRAGLPVPAGWVVEQGTDAADAAVSLVRALQGCPCVVVRSAFAVEDGPAASQAGAFDSVLDVDARDATAMSAAIERVRASAGARAVGRLDVLVQRQVDARVAGVAFTESDHEDDLVEWVEGLSDRLLSGREVGRSWELPKLRPEDLWGGPRSVDPAQRRLQILLRGVRRVFGHTDLDVEWADDGRRVYLVQVRPVTAAPVRDEWFTVANHREILPELPSEAMTSVLAHAAPELYGWYRRHDPDLPKGRLFLEVFCGRPRINLGLLVDTVRILGLPTRLVTDSIGGGPGTGPQPQPLRWGRALRRAPTLLRLLRSQRGAERAARAAERRFEAILAALGPEPELTAIGDALASVYVDLVHAMFALTAAMSGPLALLRRLGTIEVHGASHRTVTTRMWEELEDVRPALTADDREACAAGFQPRSDRGVAALAAWISRWGHRGVFESDVARPRFSEDPTPVLRALATPPGPRGARPRPTLSSYCTRPLWWVARGPLAARERLRDGAMRAFARLREAALLRAQRLVELGRIEDGSSIWSVDISVWRDLESGQGLGAARIAEGVAAREEVRALRLMDVFRRRSPIEPVDEGPPGTASRRLRGLGLTRGAFEGEVVVLGEPTELLPDGVEPSRVVLVAPAIDIGWVPILTTVGGLVVEIGGELSHGSILVREVGLPAVTNVSGALAMLRTGDRVRIDGATGQVERLRGADAEDPATPDEPGEAPGTAQR
ncbi:MAG: PEP-utilizing enzyme [Planctomycetota bacterium]|nr:PEP-utilizing enzyme [Planctomycetota bacterium]